MGKLIVVIYAWLFQCTIGADYKRCDSPQHIKYRKPGVLSCSSIGKFAAVFWYNSSNIVDNPPIVTLANSVKGGYGYESGEFDINSNGSLIILEVDKAHGNNFTVAKFTSLNQNPTVYVVSAVVTGVIPDGCESPQYLEYGRAGVVHCSFPIPLHRVLWYNSTDTVDNAPIASYSQSGENEQGNDSKEFHIFTNGSLLIHEVGLVHEHEYTVVTFGSLNGNPTYFDVRVIVIVKSTSGVPLVNKCQNVNTTCYMQLDSSSAITCSVYRVRPAVSITWLERTLYGNRNISTNMHYIYNNVTFTSFATTSFVSALISVLSLFVCRAELVPGVLQSYETMVLVQNKDRNLSSVAPIVRYAALNSTFELKCTSSKVGFLVWKRSFPFDNQFDNTPPIIYIENHQENKHENHVTLGENGSLILRRIHPQQDGFYGCIYGDGIIDGIMKYKIVSYVKPVPGYPVISHCNDQQKCTLLVERTGNLTCSVRGVLPKVVLEWKINEGSIKTITLYNEVYHVIKTGETFNVTLTSSYTIVSGTEVSVECRVIGLESEIFGTKSVVDLQYYSAKGNDSTDVPATHDLIWILCVVPMAIVFACVVTLFKVISKKKKGRKPNEEEGHTLLEQNRIYVSLNKEKNTGKQCDVFKEELLETFRDFCGASSQHPSTSSESRYKNDYYVDGCMEISALIEGNDHQYGRGESKTLTSYKEIVNDPQFKSAVVVLLGKAGVGKTAIALQIMNDWWKREQHSDQKHSEIFIYLPLKRLGKIRSFYRAVKKVSLPSASDITETEIKTILSGLLSLTIVFDGYDEYPDKDEHEGNIVIEVMKEDIFKDATVIVTTRTPFYPQNCERHIIREIRVTGFDNNAKDEYITKVVSGDKAAAKKIKLLFNQNALLSDLSRTPLIFVKIVDVVLSLKESQKLLSVTNLFSKIVSCFDSHMDSKMTQTENETQYNLFEKENKKLNKVAFEALTRSNHTRWERENLSDELTQELYLHYVRYGVLIEENLQRAEMNSDSTLCDNQNVIMVRFYHDLFCEWFAAHHVTNFISNVCIEPGRCCSGLGSSYCYEDLDNGIIDRNYSDPVGSFFQKADPFKLPYIYRFACGLNKNSAEHVIKWLNRDRQTELFAILCTLEKDGDVRSIAESLRNLCSTDIFVRNSDSMLQQRTVIQLLEIASQCMVPIVKLWLANTLRVADISRRVLHLRSNFQIPVLNTLKELEICENGTTMSEKEFGNIVKYLSECPMLEEVVFNRCLLPQSIEQNSVSLLKSKQIQAFWSPFNKWYRLNLISGQWEILDRYGRITSRHITDKQYQYLEKKVRSYRRCNTSVASLSV